ncbi:MAG: glycoside hydrolase family 9 protein [Bacteroidales bacterium]|nr:glycoside hydrolase family 9 protein [Bacteroidales bacterium]
MKHFLLSITAISALTASASVDAVRVNALGYLPGDIKAAVLMVESPDASVDGIAIIDQNGVKHAPDSVVKKAAWAPMGATYRIYFSSLTAPGEYTIVAPTATSPVFRIGDDVYKGANEVPLQYMRQQRCGYNPSLDAICHQHDGYLVLTEDGRDGQHVDVRGGWHDASDYLQYLTTSANAVFQMLWAYRENPDAWADNYQADGRKGANGIPDILDEARWGLEWMCRMNPEEGFYLNQIADDRDHRFSGLPADDNVDYGWGKGTGRPVYPCSGKPYGLQENKNRSRGLASSVGKFASSFGLGAMVFESIDPDFANQLHQRSATAYEVAQANPGACQTAPCVSPYFYEEDNWVDDMDLAAAIRQLISRADNYKHDAVNYGRMEPVTPWMGADSARHYQWYPFVNLGHVLLARDADQKVAREFTANMRSGLDRVKERAGDNAFVNGIPFIWCSNNLTVALVTQAMLYRDLTGDTQYQEMETAMRDWLFGVNPWGKCMIVGLPQSGDFPRDPHSALTNLEGIQVTGGLVDGPVYGNIFRSLRGVHLRNEDRYAPYQNDIVVYHDDYHDYSTNEPTMDGTASLTYMLGRLALGK